MPPGFNASNPGKNKTAQTVKIDMEPGFVVRGSIVCRKRLIRLGCRKIRRVSREYYTRKLDGGVIFPESGIARIFLIYFIQKPVPTLSSDDPVRLILSIWPRSLTMQFSRKI